MFTIKGRKFYEKGITMGDTIKKPSYTVCRKAAPVLLVLFFLDQLEKHYDQNTYC